MGTADLLSADSFACLGALRDGGARFNNEDSTLLARPQRSINLLLEAARSAASCQWPDSSSLIRRSSTSTRQDWERNSTRYTSGVFDPNW